MKSLQLKPAAPQVRTLKQQNNTLADEASNAKFKLVDAQQEQLKLKGQIVEVRVHPVSSTCSLACSDLAAPQHMQLVLACLCAPLLSCRPMALAYSPPGLPSLYCKNNGAAAFMPNSVQPGHLVHQPSSITHCNAIASPVHVPLASIARLLTSFLLQSPDRLQARLEELAGSVEKERGLVTEAERRSRDLQARMDTIARVPNDIP